MTEALTLPDFLGARAAETSGAVWTYLDGNGREVCAVTAADLHKRAACLAGYLTETARQGDRAVLAYSAGPEFLEAFFGCLYAGLVPIPAPMVRAGRKSARMQSVLSDSSAALLLTAGAACALVDNLAKEARCALVCTDELDNHPGHFRPLDCAPEQLAYLQYTSGSTSNPQGVMISHRNVLSNLECIDVSFRHTRQSVIVTWLPHFHDMGLVYGLLMPLYARCRGIVLRTEAFSQNPIVWLRTISTYQATHSGGPNFAYDLCTKAVREEDLSGIDLGSWRIAFNGAEPVRMDTIDAFARTLEPFGFHRQSLVPAYGLAEATLKVSGGDGGNPRAQVVDRDSLIRGHATPATGKGRSVVSCGPPADLTEVITVSLADRRICAEGEVGEVWVNGPGVAAGYWNQPERTREVFEAQIPASSKKYLRTGDLGYFDGGELYITGRLKDVILLRGRNHYPEDLEGTARHSHPALMEGVGAAFSFESDGQERLALLHEYPRNAQADFGEVIKAMRAAISAEHELQAAAVVLVRAGTLPRTTSGKIRRSACRAAWLEKRLVVVAASILGSDAQAGEVQDVTSILARIIAGELGVAASAIKLSDPIESLGLDSIAAMRVIHRVRSQIGAALQLTDLIDGITIAQLAARLAESVPAAGEISTPRREVRPDPEQQRLWLLDQNAGRSGRYNLCASAPIETGLPLAEIEHALGYVVARHETLRSRFISDPVGLRIVVEERAATRISCIDLCSAEPEYRRLLEESCIAAQAQLPLDLSAAEPIRVTALRLDSGRLRLILTAHHAAADGRSLDLLLRELVQVCEARASGAITKLPDLGSGYYGARRGAYEESHVAYWETRLAGAVATSLPHDSAAPSRNRRYRHVLGVSRSERIRRLAREHGATPFTVLLAAYFCWLQSLTGSEDLVIAVPMDRRSREELEPLIGPFAIPVPLRLQLNGNLTFASLLHRVRRELLTAQTHCELPYSRIVEAWRASNPAAKTACSCLLGYFRELTSNAQGEHFIAGPLLVEHQPSDFDLFATYQESGDSIQALVTYDPNRFTERTVARWSEELSDVLDAFVDHPERSIQPERAEPARRSIVLAATFTCGGLLEPLEFWMAELELPFKISLAPYGQVMESLLDPAGAFAGKGAGNINVCLIRLEDWNGDAQEFCRALGTAAERGLAPELVLVLPPSPATVGNYLESAENIRHAAVAIGARFQDGGQLIHDFDIGSWFDARTDRLGHAPCSDEYLAALATSIARFAFAKRVGPRKVIVLDCDETLWGGICSEDGIDGIAIDADHHRFHEFLIQQQQSGALLCMCSKNDEPAVSSVFSGRRDLTLRLEHFVSTRINWLPKSENLRSLAEELNLGLESFLLIDDDPIECSEVRHTCPPVLVVQWPGPTAGLQLLQRLWSLDRFQVTEEDRHRTEMYRQNGLRNRLEQESVSAEDFLEQLAVQVEMVRMAPHHLERASQLALRTNQFNITGARFGAAEIRAFDASPDSACFMVGVSDRFGKYGWTGFLCVRFGRALCIESFLLSCRVLGKGVEYSVLAQIGRLALENGCHEVEVRFVDSGRNDAARSFLQRIAQRTGRSREADVYVFPAKLLEQLRPERLHEPHRVVNSPALPVDHDRQTAKLLRVATELSSGRALVEVLKQWRGNQCSLTNYIAPRTETEKVVAQIWGEVLGTTRLGVLNGFFESGGQSLQAMLMLSRIGAHFGVELPLETILTHGATVESLARAIDEAQIALTPAAELASALLELSSLSDEQVQEMLGQQRS